MFKRIICLITVLLLVGAAGVWAHPVPDLTVPGSITVELHAGEEKLQGGTLTFRRVAAITEENGNFTFEATEAFRPAGADLTRVQAPETAKALLAFAVAHGLPGREIPLKDSRVVFEAAPGELGLYLVSQEKPSQGYASLEPFLIAVPNLEEDAYVYDVNASPKVGTLVPELPPPPPDLPDTGVLYWPVLVLAAGGLLLLVVGISLKAGRKKQKNEE